MICLVMGLLCIGLATLYIPAIVIKARKFALLFSFGSIFFLSRSATRVSVVCLARVEHIDPFQFLHVVGSSQSHEASD
jgi:hypothetical protein